MKYYIMAIAFLQELFLREDNNYDYQGLRRRSRLANPNWGVSIREDFFEEQIRAAKASVPYRAEFITKFCNRKQNVSHAWLSYDAVARAMDETGLTLADFAGCNYAAGIDLAVCGDFTAATMAIELGGVIHLFTQFFYPRGHIEEAAARDKMPYLEYARQGLITISGENQTDYHDVFNWLHENGKRHKLKCSVVGYDKYQAAYLVRELESYKYDCDDVRQGFNLTPVLTEFEGLLNDGKIKICGQNHLLMAHFLNVSIKRKPGADGLMPLKYTDSAHIDGFMSVIDALTVRQKHYKTLGRFLSNEARQEWIQKTARRG